MNFLKNGAHWAHTMLPLWLHQTSCQYYQHYQTVRGSPGSSQTMTFQMRTLNWRCWGLERGIPGTANRWVTAPSPNEAPDPILEIMRYLPSKENLSCNGVGIRQWFFTPPLQLKFHMRACAWPAQMLQGAMPNNCPRIHNAHHCITFCYNHWRCSELSRGRSACQVGALSPSYGSAHIRCSPEPTFLTAQNIHAMPPLSLPSNLNPTPMSCSILFF